MRPGMATMPVPSMMVWGSSWGTFLEMNSIAVCDGDVDAEEHLRSGSHGHGGYVGD